jgi:hypothetical protein
MRAWVRVAPGALVSGLLLPATAAAQSCPPLPRAGQGPAAAIAYLADDALEGRAAGTEGGRCAAAFLVARFAELGLEPAGSSGGGWLQPFPLRVGAELAGANRFRLGVRELALGEEWTPYGFSASGSLAGPVVYGGTGVAQPGGERPIAVSGRIVAIEVETPGTGSLYGDPHFKATIATRRGARAVILLSDRALPSPADDSRAFLSAPVVVVTGRAADRVRDAARAGGEASLDVRVRPLERQIGNVLGLLPGADPALREELIVVGAHFDHLGRGRTDASRAQGGSPREARGGMIHNGADDNASGTAALLEVARRLGAGPAPARSVLFVGFDAEELGMVGSEVYATAPVRPLARTVAMLNLDMVGRLAENGLTVFGTGTARGWDAALDAARAALPAPVPFGRVADGRGSSDHATFEERGVPALHFYTGTHDDYHRPSDDWQRVDAEGVERIAELVAELTLRLAGRAGVAPVTPAR